MSKAFTRESDDDGATEQPERTISSWPNLVTAAGLAGIDAEIDRFSRDQAEALGGADKDAAARAARELRYWTARRNSAQIIAPPQDIETVRFGSTVTLEREDGRKVRWRIVGEDEADPAAGTLSHASPLARALMGKETGDAVHAGDAEMEIVEISA